MEDGRLPRRSEDPNKQRKKKTLRFKIVLFVLLHITILGYQLSNVISDKEKDAVVSTTEGLRKACPRRKLVPDITSNVLFNISENFLQDPIINKLQRHFRRSSDINPTEHFLATLNNSNSVYVWTIFKGKGGWARFKRDASTIVFAPLIETIRHPEANAWKFAVNYLQPGRKASGSKDVHLFGELSQHDVDGLHFDQVVARDGMETCRMKPLELGIYYVLLPKDMIGGEVSFHRQTAGADLAATSNHIMTVTPSENMLVTSRGNIAHT